jgi:hypothetical protein
MAIRRGDEIERSVHRGRCTDRPRVTASPLVLFAPADATMPISEIFTDDDFAILQRWHDGDRHAGQSLFAHHLDEVWPATPESGFVRAPV